MANVCTPGTSGQNPAPSAPSNPTTHAEILDAVRDISARMDALGQRFDRLHRRALQIVKPSPAPPPDEPLDQPTPDGASRPIPALALRSDGKVLLSTEYLPGPGPGINGRERWEGWVLTGSEAWDMLGHVSEGCDGAASRAAARIIGK